MPIIFANYWEDWIIKFDFSYKPNNNWPIQFQNIHFVLSLPINMLQCLIVLCQTIPLSRDLSSYCYYNSSEAVSRDWMWTNACHPYHFTGYSVFRPLGMNVSENVFVILSNSTCNEILILKKSFIRGGTWEYCTAALFLKGPFLCLPFNMLQVYHRCYILYFSSKYKLCNKEM